MSSHLSLSAIHHIIVLVQNDDRSTDRTNKRPADEPPSPRFFRFKPQRVNSEWWALCVLMRIKAAPPLYYIRSFELALVLKGEVDNEDVRAIFAHHKLEFWGCPRQLVSKLVGAFRDLQKEPAFLDVTITALQGFGAMMPSEAWSQVYRTHMPCYACTTVQTVQRQSLPRPRPLRYSGGTVDATVEKFHIYSERFAQRLTVELQYQLVDKGKAMWESKHEKSSVIHCITIRLDNETCAAKERIAAIADRSRPTLMLLADVASGVYGFLDRAHIGSSLLANKSLGSIILQLKRVVPIHRLKCGFEKHNITRLRTGWYGVTYWLVIRHFQHDLSYTDRRSIELPSTASANGHCASIRHYLSNCHVDDLVVRADFFRFAMKMLPCLAGRNFSIDRLELAAAEQRLSDYRSMDTAFGEMQMNTLSLNMTEHRFVELVKITDFFRMPTIQGLRRLELSLSGPCTKAKMPRSQVVSKNPLWLSGIHLLRNCNYYRVACEVENAIRGARRLRRIERSVVRICEAFERGEIIDTVEHFRFGSNSNASCVFCPAFSRDNLLVSAMTVEGPTHQPGLSDFEWDVYRFRNANTGEYLTACVGRHIDNVENDLHILKGEVYPNASFAS